MHRHVFGQTAIVTPGDAECLEVEQGNETFGARPAVFSACDISWFVVRGRRRSVNIVAVY